MGKRKGPEPKLDDRKDPFYDIERVASTTECTGLTPTAVLDDEEAKSYEQLYAVHRQKPVNEK